MMCRKCFITRICLRWGEGIRGTQTVLDLSGYQYGVGRELFVLMRAHAGDAQQGACALFPPIHIP